MSPTDRPVVTGPGVSVDVALRERPKGVQLPGPTSGYWQLVVIVTTAVIAVGAILLLLPSSP